MTEKKEIRWVFIMGDAGPGSGDLLLGREAKISSLLVRLFDLHGADLKLRDLGDGIEGGIG